MFVKRSHFFAIALALTAPLLVAANGAMSVAAFLAKAEPLQKRGALAVFDGNFRELMNEVRAASQSYRHDLTEQAKRGDAPHSCPPAKVKMSSDDVMAIMRAVPANERPTTTVKQAFAANMKKRFPCANKSG